MIDRLDGQLRQDAESAIRHLDDVIAMGPRAPHRDISEAVQKVVQLRNRAIDQARTGGVPHACVDRANSLLSLAYGAEFPLIGFHQHRLEQTRDGIKALLG